MAQIRAPALMGMTTKRSSGDQNYEEFKGATPFFLAAKAADLPMMHLLLAAKADYSDADR